ncbi:unnamed protein product, partial [Closterium sp. NIES-53]
MTHGNFIRLLKRLRHLVIQILTFTCLVLSLKCRSCDAFAGSPDPFNAPPHSRTRQHQNAQGRRLLYEPDAALRARHHRYRHDYVEAASVTSDADGNLGVAADRSSTGVNADLDSPARCWSMSERRYYRSSYSNKARMSEALVQRLQHYSTLHAACTAPVINWPAFFNDSSKGLQENATAAQVEGCKYLLWVEPNYSGLGNQLLSLVSSFTYALLTNRTLIINPECFPARLLCNPFPYSSWAPPALNRGSFNHMRLRAEKRRVGYNAFQEPGMPAANTTDGAADDAADAVYSNLNYSVNDTDLVFFCSQEQERIRAVRFLALLTEEYVLPGLYLVSEFDADLERLVPDRLPLMHVGRYLLHPANYLWEEITRAFRAYLAPHQHRFGIQIRDFTPDSSNEGEALARVLHCAVNISHGLPPTLSHDQWRLLGSNQSAANSSDMEPIQKAAGAGTVRSVGVLVASLKRSYVDALHEAYVEGLPLEGYNVAVTSLSHEGEQKTGDLLQLERALKEMWLLSMCDLLLVSDSSTFGYMAAGLAGVSPFSLNIVPRMKSDWLHNGRPACVVTTPEPCYLTMLDNKQQHVQ